MSIPSAAPHLRYGGLYVIGLVSSSTALTAILAMTIWTIPDASLMRSMPWLTLWTFTVVTPALSSLRLHRRLESLVTTPQDVPRDVIRDLAHLRWTLLMQGGMAMLAALTLYLNG